MAQVMLEQTYKDCYSFQTVNLEGDGTKYLAVDTTTKHVLLYNEDHSLWKRIETSLPDGASFMGVACVSRKLINIDDEIELTFSYTKSGISTTRIYKEDGSIYQTIFDAYRCQPVKVNSKWKIIAYKPSNGYEVYSVPGEYLGISKPGGSSGDVESSSTFFPNPMEASATLKYTLPAGIREGTVSIYDIKGNSIRSYRVTDQFSEILIARGDLSAGMYTYTLQTPGGAVSSDRFVIK